MAAGRLDAAFAAALAGPRARPTRAAGPVGIEAGGEAGGVVGGEAGGEVGIEQEFRVRDAARFPVDFAALLPDLLVDGRRLDPADPNARRCRSGAALTCDGAEAEVAAPPVRVRPGFTEVVEAWGRTARAELERVLPARLHAEGYATHVNVAAGGDRGGVERLARAYAATFGPALLLLADGARSPGLLVRPRPGRLELGVEYLDGDTLRAAAAFAAGSTRAAAAGRFPPAVDVEVVASVERYGWYLDRAAAGVDLLAEGRGARLPLAPGGTTGAQAHLEASWAIARSALAGVAAPADLDAADRLVAGERPLPSEDVRPRPPAPGAEARSPALGGMLRRRARPGFAVDVEAATWTVAVFRLTARSGRTAYASVPRTLLGRFLSLLDRGRLDGVLRAFLARPPAGRQFRWTAEAPRAALADAPPGPGALVPPERLPSGLYVPAVAARAAKERAFGDAVPPRPGESVTTPAGAPVPPPPPAPRPRRRRALAGVGLGAALAAVLGVGAWAVLRDGGAGPGPRAGAERPGGTGGRGVPGLPACGAALADGVATIEQLRAPCEYPAAARAAGAAPYPEYERGGGGGGGAGRAPFVGPTCVDHSPAAPPVDAVTGEVGLSFIGLQLAGLDPGQVIEGAVDGPSGTFTGRGRADADGYVLVPIPIVDAAPHTLVSVADVTDADASNGTGGIRGFDLASFAPAPGRVVDAGFPGRECDRAAVLAAAAAAEGARTTGGAGTAGVETVLAALAHPGRDVDLTSAGPAVERVEYARVEGRAPEGVASHGARAVGPVEVAQAEAWEEVFPCGPGQVAYTVCAGDAAAPSRRGLYVLVAGVWGAPVPLEPEAGARRALVYSAGRAWEIVPGPGGWVLRGHGGAPTARARVLVRNGAVVWLVPMEDAAGALEYRIESGAGPAADVQPPPGEPAAQITGPPVPVTPLPPREPSDSRRSRESVQEFLTALGRALTDEDARFLRARMHPAVVARYGGAACDAYAAGDHAPVRFEVLTTGPPGDYEWTTDGVSEIVPRTREVSVRATSGGETAARVVHVARAGGRWRWFTDCSPP